MDWMNLAQDRDGEHGNEFSGSIKEIYSLVH